MKLHPMFHVGFLKPFHFDPVHLSRGISARALPGVCVQFDREIAQIFGHRILGMSRQNQRVEFLVQWIEQSKVEAT